MRACVFIYTCLCACVYMCACANVSVSLSLTLSLRLCVCVRAYVCIYVCVCVPLYVGIACVAWRGQRGVALMRHFVGSAIPNVSERPPTHTAREHLASHPPRRCHRAGTSASAYLPPCPAFPPTSTPTPTPPTAGVIVRGRLCRHAAVRVAVEPEASRGVLPHRVLAVFFRRRGGPVLRCGCRRGSVSALPLAVAMVMAVRGSVVLVSGFLVAMVISVGGPVGFVAGFVVEGRANACEAGAGLKQLGLLALARVHHVPVLPLPLHEHTDSQPHTSMDVRRNVHPETHAHIHTH